MHVTIESMTIDDTKPTLYEVLEAWTRAWEELLKEPVDLLLNRSFCNLVVPTLVETKPYFIKSKLIERSAQGWARGLLELLEARFRDNDIDIYFYRLEYPKEIQELDYLLKQGKFDVPAIFPILETIKDGPSPKTILGALRSELTPDREPDFDRFVTGSALILRRSLSTQTISSLKDKLSISLSRHGMGLAVTSVLPRIRGDEQLFLRLSESWKLFVGESRSFDLDSVKTDLDQGITGVFKLFSWDFKVREVLQKTRATISALFAVERANMEGDEGRVRSRVKQQLNRLLWQEYSVAYLTQLFEMPIGGARFESEHLESIGQELATVLLSTSFEDKQFRHSEPYRPNPVDACCSDAFVKTIKTIARDKFSSSVNNDHEFAKLDDNLVTELVRRLWDDKNFQAIEWEKATDTEIDEACEQWLSSVELQKELVEILTPLNQALIVRFRQLLSDSQLYDLNEWIDGDLFWQQWRDNLSKMAPWDRGVFHYIPWDSFDESAINDLFSHLIPDFQRIDDAWVVVLAIHNLDPPQTPKRITGITFYDPSRWDYGERVVSSAGSNEHMTSAKLEVTAKTFLEAKRIAATQLSEVLNCMALSLTVSRVRGGFKPTIDPEIFARRLATPSWSSDRPLVRNERPITQSFLNFERFGPMFDFLIQASRSASATMLQLKLLKALHWYAKARWEDDAAQSLLFYWIALEHLFEEGNDDRLLNMIAALHINWRDVLSHGWYFLRRHQDEVIKKLKIDQDMIKILRTHPDLKDWDRDYRVLFSHNNVQTLIGLIPCEKKSLKDYVQGYSEYLYGFVKDKALIIEDMEALRAKYRFRLLVIKQIRNDIVHQALGYERNVGLYTDELEKVFEETIVKLTNDAIRAVPQCASIKDLIAQYEELWIS